MKALNWRVKRVKLTLGFRQQKRNMKPKISALALLLLISNHTSLAHARFDVQRFQSFRGMSASEKERDIAYLIGVSRGLILADMYSEKKFGIKQFCIPEDKFKEAYGGSIQILNSEIASPSTGKPYPPQTPIEAVMVQAFATHYSCPNN